MPLYGNTKKPPTLLQILRRNDSWRRRRSGEENTPANRTYRRGETPNAPKRKHSSPSADLQTIWEAVIVGRGKDHMGPQETTGGHGKPRAATPDNRRRLHQQLPPNSVEFARLQKKMRREEGGKKGSKVSLKKGLDRRYQEPHPSPIKSDQFPQRVRKDRVSN